jgi:Glucodextranase, domain B
VLSNPLRGVLLAGALTLLAATGGPIASAGATVTASRIAAPADPTYLLYDQTTQAPTSTLLTVSGTTTGEGKVDVRCYYGKEAGSYRPIAEGVEPIANAFSVEVKAESLYFGPCVLRAVPSGDKEAHAPGVASPFEGPRLIASHFRELAENNDHYTYGMEASTLSSYLGFESAGECGLDYSNLYAPTSLAESEGLFDCDAGLYEAGPENSETNRHRSEVQIDGANALTPAGAHYVESKLNVTIPGASQVTVTKTYEAGIVTIHEVDPIVKCAPEASVPATVKGCAEFVSTGVQLERVWQAGDGGQVVTMTDNWSSTDGSAHSLNALYDQETINAAKEGGAYEFPGASAFAATAGGQTVALPSGPGAIDYKDEAATPVGGDGEHLQGAIAYDRSPSSRLEFYRGTKATEDYNGFVMPYQGTIPGTGTYTLRMGFVQAYALPEAQSLAAALTSSFAPTLSVASPANGTTVSAPSVTVSGTASDTGVLSSVTVAGQAVSVGAGGAWSTSVALARGANTIMVVATDQAGIATTKSVSVTYAPPAARASQIGAARGSNGEVTLTLACTGAAGTSCEIESTLTTFERLRNGRPVAVLAGRHRRSRTRDQRIVVGASKLTIPAGQRVTIGIELNAHGKALLARFGHLPVHLSVVLISAGQRSTVIAQNVTVKKPHRTGPKHHGRHQHRHRRRRR